MPEYITDGIKISNDSVEEILTKKILLKKILMKKTKYNYHTIKLIF